MGKSKRWSKCRKSRGAYSNAYNEWFPKYKLVACKMTHTKHPDKWERVLRDLTDKQAGSYAKDLPWYEHIVTPLSTLLLAMDQTSVTYSGCQPEKLPLATYCNPSTFLRASAHSGNCYHSWVHVGGVPLNLPTFLLELTQLSASLSVLCLCSESFISLA